MILCLWKGYTLFLLSLCCASQLLYFTAFSKGPHLFFKYLFLIFTSKKRAATLCVMVLRNGSLRVRKKPEMSFTRMWRFRVFAVGNFSGFKIILCGGNSDGVEWKYKTASHPDSLQYFSAEVSAPPTHTVTFCAWHHQHERLCSLGLKGNSTSTV